MVSAVEGEFETGMSEKGQVKQQILLAEALCINQLVIAVNKMDSTSPPYSRARYDEIKKLIGDFIKNLGFSEEAVPFIPISGVNGENLVVVSTNMLWYKGWKTISNRNCVEGIMS